MSRFFTTEKISEHRKIMPNGFLLCEEVAIARTGEQEYLATELPILEAKEGLVMIDRPAAQVFSEATMASFEGMPFTIEHPDAMVTVDNWEEYAAGFVTNIHKGIGNKADLLLADIVVTKKEAIALILGGMTEISCGYDADYVQDTPGKAMQTNIKGNHVALVHAGRCGGRCSIGDNKLKENAMAVKSNTSLSERFFAKLGMAAWTAATKDEEAEQKEAKPMPTDAVEGEDHSTEQMAELVAILSSFEKRLARLEGNGDNAKDFDPEQETAEEREQAHAAEDEESASEKEEAKMASESKDACPEDKNFYANVKLFLPDMSESLTRDSCATRRMALGMAVADASIDRAVKSILGNKTIATADRMTLSAAFLAAAEIKRSKNTAAYKVSDSKAGTPVQKMSRNTYDTIKEINEKNHKFFNGGK